MWIKIVTYAPIFSPIRTKSDKFVSAYTVLTGDTVYGTAGGDIVEHAAPRERSSDTGRGSGNPRDTASTSPSNSRNHGSPQEKQTCDWTTTQRAIFLDGYLGCKDEPGEPARAPGRQTANWSTAISEHPHSRRWQDYRLLARVNVRAVDLSLLHAIRTSPYSLAFSAGGREY